jgi:hypothetical protein
VNRYPQSFPVLLGWWKEENKKGRHLWPGISVNRDTSNRSLDETINQIMIDRGMIPESKGIVHWSISSVIRNTRLADTLLKGVYRKQALVPSSPWMDNKAPAAPAVTTESQNEFLKISWTHPEEKDVFRWAVYYKYNERWSYTILNRNERTFSLRKTVGENANKQVLNTIIVTAVDRTGNESEKRIVSVWNE